MVDRLCRGQSVLRPARLAERQCSRARSLGEGLASRSRPSFAPVRGNPTSRPIGRGTKNRAGSKNRFKQIVRGKIKGDLRKYITHGEMIGKTGGELVSIPLPQIQIPEFRYGSKNSGGVGQGPGDVGTPIGRASDGDGAGGAGEAPGHHILEVEADARRTG